MPESNKIESSPLICPQIMLYFFYQSDAKGEKPIMSIAAVREYFRQYGLEERVQEFDVSSATVDLAAAALGCAPERIAKSLTFLVDDRCVMIVTAGDAKIDNSKYKNQFGTKAKMLSAEQVKEMVGHTVG